MCRDECFKAACVSTTMHRVTCVFRVVILRAIYSTGSNSHRQLFVHRNACSHVYIYTSVHSEAHVNTVPWWFSLTTAARQDEQVQYCSTRRQLIYNCIIQDNEPRWMGWVVEWPTLLLPPPPPFPSCLPSLRALQAHYSCCCCLSSVSIGQGGGVHLFNVPLERVLPEGAVLAKLAGVPCLLQVHAPHVLEEVGDALAALGARLFDAVVHRVDVAGEYLLPARLVHAQVAGEDLVFGVDRLDVVLLVDDLLLADGAGAPLFVVRRVHVPLDVGRPVRLVVAPGARVHEAPVVVEPQHLVVVLGLDLDERELGGGHVLGVDGRRLDVDHGRPRQRLLGRSEVKVDAVVSLVADDGHRLAAGGEGLRRLGF